MENLYEEIEGLRAQVYTLRQQLEPIQLELQNYPAFQGQTPLDLQFYQDGKKRKQVEAEDLEAKIRKLENQMKELQGRTQTRLFGRT